MCRHYYFRDRNTGIWDEVSIYVTGVSSMIHAESTFLIFNMLLYIFIVFHDHITG